MKRFQFRLDRVRQYRFLQLELEEANLEKAYAAKRRIEDQIHHLIQQQAEADAAVVSPAKRPAELRVYEHLALRDFHHWAKGEAQRLQALLQEAERDIEAQRARVLEANRKHEILARYKQTSRRRWQHEVDREWENLAGELYLARWKQPS